MENKELMSKYSWLLVIVAILLVPVAVPIATTIILIAIGIFLVLTMPFWIIMFIEATKDIIKFLFVLFIIAFAIWATVTVLGPIATGKALICEGDNVFNCKYVSPEQTK